MPWCELPVRGARAGFSFAELMCGVVILLLLCGITITWYQESIEDAKRSVARIEAAKVADAITAWQTRTRAPYIAHAPPPDYKGGGLDPWGQPFLIDPAARVIASSGPDRASGSDDDIRASWAEMALPSPVATQELPVTPAVIPSSSLPTLRVVVEPGVAGKARLRVEARSHGSELSSLTVGELVFPLRGFQQVVAAEQKPPSSGKLTVTLVDKAGGRATTEVAFK